MVLWSIVQSYLLFRKVVLKFIIILMVYVCRNLRRNKLWEICRALVPNDYMSCAPKPLYCYLNNVSNIKILLQLHYRCGIKHNARYTHIKTTINSNLLVIFDKCLNHSPLLQLFNFLNMSVDKCIFCALLSFSHNFFKYWHLSIVQLAMLVKLMVYFLSKVLFLHLKINVGQVYDVLSCIVDHICV